MNARFMVDVLTYNRMHDSGRREHGKGSSKFDTWPLSINREDEISDELAMLLPSTTYGFNLHEKKWGEWLFSNYPCLSR